METEHILEMVEKAGIKDRKQEDGYIDCLLQLELVMQSIKTGKSIDTIAREELEKLDIDTIAREELEKLDSIGGEK